MEHSNLKLNNPHTNMSLFELKAMGWIVNENVSFDLKYQISKNPSKHL